MCQTSAENLASISPCVMGEMFVLTGPGYTRATSPRLRPKPQESWEVSSMEPSLTGENIQEIWPAFPPSQGER